jgi:prophage antirepressor-like protein
MSQLVKVTSNIFGEVEVDFFKNENGDIIMTAEQIGSALGYTNPSKAILNLYKRNEKRFEKFSTTLETRALDGKLRETRIFNEKGIYEVIRKSTQPKADEFYDWVFDVIQQIRKTGFYMTTSDVKVPELLEKVNQLEHKIDSFVTLTSYESSLLQKAIAKRVCGIQPDKDERGELFREVHREIRDRFGVPSYRDVARVDFQMAMNYVTNWVPKKRAA